MHRSTSHAILIHRRGFRTSHRRCATSQRVAGPISTDPDCTDPKQSVHEFKEAERGLRYLTLFSGYCKDINILYVIIRKGKACDHLTMS